MNENRLHKPALAGAWLSKALVILCLLSGQSAVARAGLASDSHAFTYQRLQAYARALTSEAHVPATMAENNPLRSLSYDDYRRIVYDPEAAVWRDDAAPFQLQLFHPGYLHTTPVRVHLLRGGIARRLAFRSDLFNYHDSPVDRDRVEANGYAGFRVHHPINTPARYEEFLLFLGASYFRAVGRDQFYGLSARGLAINTVGLHDEEFPRFTDFWVERPAVGTDRITIYALLDSRSVVGAYRFVVSPGEQTMMEVEANLYPRRDTQRIGIAPLTSMFFFDATNRAIVDDFRNAVHDSDGLQILQANGEQIWRPLANPAQVQVSTFGATADTPVGFGLLQRHTAFTRFNDNEARYDKRPSLWIEPLGEWGAGRVKLVEIPTLDEYHDNIVAYWQPHTGLEVGHEYRFRYRMHWGGGSPFALEQGRVVDTAAGATTDSAERLFVIDYSDGRRIPAVMSDPEAVRIIATTSAGDIIDASGTLVDSTGHYRAYVKFDPGRAARAELRVVLETEGQQWGETWLYRWTR